MLLDIPLAGRRTGAGLWRMKQVLRREFANEFVIFVKYCSQFLKQDLNFAFFGL